MARAILIPPDVHAWVESDSVDRGAFARLADEAPSLAALLEAGETLLPHFRALLGDVFCLLYKLEPRVRDAAEVGPSAALNRILLDGLREHPLFAPLRAETQLDEVRAGLATVLLGEELLVMLRAERLLPRGDMVDLWDLARQEDQVRRRAEEAESLGDTDANEATRADAERAAQVAAATLRQKTALVAERLREMPVRAQNALGTATGGLRREVAEAGQEAHGWGTGLGAGGRSSPGRTIELGRRLARNPKLRKLAALVGRMRAQAMALRRRSLERPSDEVHAIHLSGDLDRLLPPELLALRHPILRRDFARRLVEGRLQAYKLRGVDEHGRGPMIVCLDGSASMAGEKELWAKAVALTLLEIARRQRRLFRFICFSSKDVPLWTLDLNPREHHTVRADRALDVAEYFPGGGTDFEAPLDAAVDGLSQARYRRGDVVLITDGECQVAPEWRERFLRTKQRLDFTLYAVLIDVGSSSLDALEGLADRVTRVSQLDEGSARDLFLAVR
jgi:uncharacterized protein with von Willebrand factor type A (vWA) domain